MQSLDSLLRWAAMAAILLLAGVAWRSPGATSDIPLSAGQLRCEYLSDPLGIDTPAPRLSWVLASTQRGQGQTAYQILVASRAQWLTSDRGDVWDSGKVASRQPIQIAYEGVPLVSGRQYFWKVRVWDKGDKPSPWSDPTSWTAGVLKPQDWHAQWISGQTESASDDSTPSLGYHAAEAASADDVKWVQVDLGRQVLIDTVVLHPLRHDGADGFGFPLRFLISASDSPEFKDAKTISDQTAADYPSPGFHAVRFNAAGMSARYVRVTATRLYQRPSGDRPFRFALAELEVMSHGENAALRQPVTAGDSVEGYGWGKSQLTDGLNLAPQEKPTKVKARVTLNTMPIFRHAFSLGKPVARAVMFITGVGQYELRINGRKVSESVLDPGWTDYRKTVLYDTFDVTSLLRPGDNAIGVMLGNGMYSIPAQRYAKFRGSFGPPKLIGQIDIEYADGSRDRLVTDNSWKWSPGPITFSSIYGGEDYDARLEQHGWDAPGFNDSQWSTAFEVTGPGGLLTGAAHSAPPVRPQQVFKAQLVKEPRPGVWVYDIGQNCAIIPRITVRGSAGQTVKITPGELLNGDGTVSQASSGGPAWFEYTLGKGGAQSWAPRFTYYGCRYLQIEGTQPQSVEGLFISSASPAVGQFACSKDLFNRTNSLIRWAIRSNMMSILTDCPHRERLGWLEEDHLVGPSMMYNFSIPALYGKVCGDMSDAQLANGLVPDIAPEFAVFKGGFRDSPEWGSSCVLLPWQLYQWYGDTRVLAEQYPTMQRYVAYLTSTAKDQIVSQGLGDWYDLGPNPPGPAQLTPTSLTATAFYFRDLTILEQTARLLQKKEDADGYQKLAAKVRDAFNKALYHSDTHSYATGSQTSNSLPLVMGLAPDADRAAILRNLTDDIARHDNRLTSGDVGYRYLLKALADGGRSDVIFDMNSRSDRPGYGYIIRTGATALTEGWDGSASQDHFMLGHIMEWFYGDLAGIRCDPQAVAFEKIVIRPSPVGDVTWVKASYDSIRGTIASSWKLQADTFTLDVTIPPGATATVYLPCADAASVHEGNALASQSAEVHLLRQADGNAVYAIDSGTYHFQSRVPASFMHH